MNLILYHIDIKILILILILIMFNLHLHLKESLIYRNSRDEMNHDRVL